MLDENLKEESTLSVKTPWGNLVRSSGIQSSLDILKEDINLIHKQIHELEKTVPSFNPPTPNPMNETALKTLSSRIDSLNDDFNSLNRRISELEKNRNKIPVSNQPTEGVIRALSAFETRIVQVENKMRDLDSKFERFSSKTLQILEQLRKGSL